MAEQASFTTLHTGAHQFRTVQCLIEIPSAEIELRSDRIQLGVVQWLANAESVV